jgi:hypothetical protein
MDHSGKGSRRRRGRCSQTRDAVAELARALRAKTRLFEQFVGRLQPILTRLPRASPI